MMTFTGDAEDYRIYPFSTAWPLTLCKGAKAEVEASHDAALVQAVGEALVREVRLLQEKSSGAASLLTPEVGQLREFGEKLIARSRTLQAKPSA